MATRLLIAVLVSVIPWRAACAAVTPAAPTSFEVGLETGAVLDNFEEGLRAYGSNPKLWDFYKGEGGTSQAATVAVDTARPRNGAKSFHYTNPGDGRTYFHFYCNNGSTWSFAHQQLVQGAWSLNAWNRMAFWVWSDADHAQGSNGHLIELGTYTRCNTCDATTQNAGGTHWYHEYNPRGGVWTKVIVDNHPQHYVGGPTTDPGVIGITGGAAPPAATSDGVSNYFDALTRWYWDYPYVTAAESVYLDDVTLYDETGQDDVAHIASLEASWNPTTHLLHIGFTRNATEDNTADTVYTGVYSTTAPINTLGFANATVLGTVGTDGLGDYVNKKIEGTVDLTGVQTVYLAVQKRGSAASVFRQMALPINAGGI